MINIIVVTRITTTSIGTAEGFHDYVNATTNLSQRTIEHGLASIENDFDEILAFPGAAAKIIKAA